MRDPPFREFNFVYGANGSGKTTLASEIEDATTDTDRSVRTFNRTYVRRVLAEVERVEGVWVVADEAAELVAERKSLEKQHESTQAAIKTSQAEQSKARSEYDAFLKEIADDLRHLRRQVTHGAATYPTTEVEEKLSGFAEDTEAAELDHADLRATIEQSELGSLGSYDLTRKKADLARLVGFFEKADFAALRRAGLYAWATNAVAVAKSHEGEPCPFCSEILTPSAIKHIEAVAAESPSNAKDFEAFRSLIEQMRTGTLGRSLPDSERVRCAIEEERRRCARSILEDSQVP